MTPSEKVSEETETSGRLFGTALLVLASVVSCTPHGTVVPVCALSWVSVITIASGPSSVSRRLSREFRLGYNVRNREDRNGITNKDAHGHERAEIEPNHDEEGRCPYERISILDELRSGTGSQYLTRGHSK